MGKLNMTTERLSREKLESALQACVDLLEDIRCGLNGPVDVEIDSLYEWHPLIRKIGGNYWRYDANEEKWVRLE